MTVARDTSLVRIRREELGMKLTELADKLERNASFVSMMEGGFVPHHARRVQVAAVLDTTPEKLWPQEYA
jgi:ribosome-binding protein aMBF1 (putative translation factor)